MIMSYDLNSLFDTFSVRKSDLLTVGVPPDPRGLDHGEDGHHGHQDHRPHPGHPPPCRSRSQVKIFEGRLISGDCRLPACAVQHCSVPVFSPLCEVLLSTGQFYKHNYYCHQKKQLASNYVPSMNIYRNLGKIQT